MEVLVNNVPGTTRKKGKTIPGFTKKPIVRITMGNWVSLVQFLEMVGYSLDLDHLENHYNNVPGSENLLQTLSWT